jgi:hypothetical protein
MIYQNKVFHFIKNKNFTFTLVVTGKKISFNFYANKSILVLKVS